MKLHIIPLLLLAGCTAIPSQITLREGENWASSKEYANFELCGQARTEADAQALVRFCQADGDEVYAYYDEISGEHFLFGVQGEGRKWTQTFSRKALGIFEYLFTDAMTIIDHKGRNSRIYRPER